MFPYRKLANTSINLTRKYIRLLKPLLTMSFNRGIEIETKKKTKTKNLLNCLNLSTSYDSIMYHVSVPVF